MNRASSMSIGLLSGLAVGAAIGMLVAPKAGVETRATLKEKAGDIRTKASDTVSRLRHRGERAIEGMTSAEYP